MPPYFHENKVAQGWSCTSEIIPPVVQKVKVGDFLMRWFPAHALPKEFVNVEGVRGAYVDAIVLDVVPKNGKNRLKYCIKAPEVI